MPRQSILPYVGSKAYYADWILEYLPDHRKYVEAFGGSASVLLAKARSNWEVYNDLDEDLANFFRVLRNQPDELAAFLESVKYDRATFERWGVEFYKYGYRHPDPVERAGRLFLLQYATRQMDLNSSGSFKTQGSGSPAKTLRNKREAIEEFSARFDSVLVESRDYRELVEDFDGPRTAWYFDPPYVGEGDRFYSHGEFDHQALVATLQDLEGYWLVSYGDELPDGLLDLPGVHQRTESVEYMVSGKNGTERLVMNFDPATTPRFAESGGRQETLGCYDQGASDEIA